MYEETEARGKNREARKERGKEKEAGEGVGSRRWHLRGVRASVRLRGEQDEWTYSRACTTKMIGTVRSRRR
jgi:hypothetical protein